MSDVPFCGRCIVRDDTPATQHALHELALDRLAWAVGLVRAEELLAQTLRRIGLHRIENAQDLREFGAALQLSSDEATWVGALLSLHGERLQRTRAG